MIVKRLISRACDVHKDEKVTYLLNQMPFLSYSWVITKIFSLDLLRQTPIPDLDRTKSYVWAKHDTEIKQSDENYLTIMPSAD